MHGDCYGEQIDFGDPHPTCWQMFLVGEGGRGSSPNIVIIVAFVFCAWMHTQVT
jgi:hypothetical protein